MSETGCFNQLASARNNYARLLRLQNVCIKLINPCAPQGYLQIRHNKKDKSDIKLI